MNQIVEVRAGVEFAAGIEKADAEAQEKRMTSLGCPEGVLKRIREKRAARSVTPRTRTATTVLSAEDAARRARAEKLGRQILADDTKARLSEM